MKGLVGWLKKNWVIVVCAAVMLASLPLAAFFALGWNKKIRETRTTDVNGLNGKVTGQDVTYTVAIPVQGAKPIELRTAPNGILTAAFVEIKNRIATEASAVVRRAEDFNKGVGADAAAVGRAPHRPLVDGVFPGATVPEIIGAIGEGAYKALAEDKKRTAVEEKYADLMEPKRREMEDALLAKGGRPDPYEALLRSLNAGGPPRASQVAQQLEDVRQREREKISAGREPTAEEQAAIAGKLVDARLGMYQRRAAELSLYATRANLGAGRGVRPIPSEDLLKTKHDLASVLEFFVFQWDLWAMNDVASAIRVVNSENGKPTTVERSVVKRIERLDVREMERLAPSPNDEGRGGSPSSPAPAAAAPAGGGVPLDLAVSFTGRTSAPANEVYDVRVVELAVVVSSERLQQLVDAISRANFHTVIGGTIERVDAVGDLERGYYYGNENVVRVTLQVETVWLRSWMAGLMPLPVRQALGVKAAGDEQMPAPPVVASPAGGAPPPASGGGGRAGRPGSRGRGDE